ncbi:MAG: RNA pseudouridine synthase [Chitinivibrionales bacterium]|nr:RNA pseudouridine synthase [Chitinivibrionales bacterium]
MIPILFEDEYLLAVDKPVGIASIPERVKTAESVYRILSAIYKTKLFVVHRLDKEVSGVLLFAKDAVTHRFLNDQFCRREIKKSYYALVHGVPSDKQWHICKPLRQFGSGRMGVDLDRGKQSITDVFLLEGYQTTSLVRVCPHTGRRHQIRVHLYSIGHPIVGDPLYGDPLSNKSSLRCLLHAHSLQFHLPDGRILSIESELPQDFKAFLP